jgi:hypothetical protein
MGMSQLGAVVRRALLFFGSDYPRDRDARTRRLQAYAAAHPEAPRPFDVLDDEFFALLKS